MTPPAEGALRIMAFEIPVSASMRYVSPRLRIPSRLFLPPLECCRGTSPNHAASYLPLSKFLASPIEATITVAVRGPIPGIASRPGLVVTRPGLDLEFELSCLSIKLLEVLDQSDHEMPKYTGQGITGTLEQSGDPCRDVADPLRYHRTVFSK